MAKKPPRLPGPVTACRYRSPNIPLSVIRQWARRLGEGFQPDQIILFGSYAYGRPHEESDVDLLVVMPARNEIDQAIRLSLAFDPPFPLDLIVRTPEHLRRDLDDGDCFLREVVSRGKVLYEKADGTVGSEG
jgi:predicted nucleotidyltransferase